jgi:hypothetical protein
MTTLLCPKKYWTSLSQLYPGDRGVFERTTRERNLSPDALFRKKTWLTGYFDGLSKDERFNIAARQAYIAFGVAIVAAAGQQVDATAMEGLKLAALEELVIGI